ncbi:MAG: DinB family protein [Deltaproteobacteria bacterium]|nr:DinB family protein [Deltaproteobacteria bacterium]
MSKDIVNSLMANYTRINGLFEKFIETCPQDIWAGKIGGFPVWQQVYHTYACFDFFLSGKGQSPLLKPLYPQEVVMFANIPDTPAEKDEITGFVKAANLYMEKFSAALDDQALSDLNEGFSARRQLPCTNAGTISSVIGHMFYHFGQCDAALRDHGLKGLL